MCYRVACRHIESVVDESCIHCEMVCGKDGRVVRQALEQGRWNRTEPVDGREPLLQETTMLDFPAAFESLAEAVVRQPLVSLYPLVLEEQLD